MLLPSTLWGVWNASGCLALDVSVIALITAGRCSDALKLAQLRYPDSDLSELSQAYIIWTPSTEKVTVTDRDGFSTNYEIGFSA